MSRETVTWKGRLGPFDLEVGRSTFRPTTVSKLVAEAIDVRDSDVVIDVGCGSGVLSIIAAKLGAKRVYGVDAADETVEVATNNATAHGVAKTTRFYQGDLFDPLPSNVEADLVIGDVSGVPDAIAVESGWFPAGLGGGPRGSELPIRMLEQAREFLKRGGRLILPTGSIQDERSILDKARGIFGAVRQMTEKRIPLPTALAGSPSLLRLAQEKVISITQRGSRWLWTARIWELTAKG
ncbi:MAG: 50S ribosomal protein L11 methyltransferase [Acidimicrobiia bacterium]|nr:50S ribosomal protein L11 methyltransferase [Acidimicrobiia bacterium]